MEGEPLPFLHHHLKSGNSLIGAEFQSRHEVAWQPGFEISTLFDIPFEQIDIDKSLWQAWDDSQIAYGKTPNADRLQHLFFQQKAKLALEKRGLLVEDWHTWAITKQQTVNRFLQLVKIAHEEFEKIQENAEMIDRLDNRNKDRLALLPDMDPVLIEAYDMVIDETLERKRKKALITELGKKIYADSVSHQRAYLRLKALGDLNTALWYWPLDQYQHYPSFAVYRELCDWLLNENTLVRGRRGKNLTSTALKTLKISLKTAKTHQFFHWQVEFAHIFADVKRFGFDAVISNPPWKPISYDDKDIIPIFHPQYIKATLNIKPELKKQMLFIPKIAKNYLDYYTRCVFLSNAWKSKNIRDIRLKGTLDYVHLFTLLTLDLLSEEGKTGLILSRDAIFKSPDISSLRKYILEHKLLKEAIIFRNKLKIFDINTVAQFVCLVLDMTPSDKNKIIYEMIDLNSLDSLDKTMNENLNEFQNRLIMDISSEIVKKNYSPTYYQFPVILSRTQHDFYKIIQESSKVIKLIDLDKKISIKRGSDTEKHCCSLKNIGSFNNNFYSNEYILILKGKNFNTYESFRKLDYIKSNIDKYKAYPIGYFSNKEIDINNRRIGVRVVSRSSDQKILISNLLQPRFWLDHNNIIIESKEQATLKIIATLFSSVIYEVLIRTIGLVSNEIIQNVVPITTPITLALEKATTVYTSMIDRDDNVPRMEAQKMVDAYVIIHFISLFESMTFDFLHSVFNSTLSTFNAHHPKYIDDAIGLAIKYNEKNELSLITGDLLIEKSYCNRTQMI